MTIRDLGYRPYEGKLLPHRSRYQVLIRRTVALAWSTRLIKITLIMSLFPMLVCGAVMFAKLRLMHQLAGSNVRIQLEDPGNLVFTCFYWCQIWFAFSMSLRVAAPAIADDIRTGALQFYFSRPVARIHYLVGKVVAVAFLVTLVSAVPALALSIFRTLLSIDGAEALKGLGLAVRVLVYAPLFAALFSLPPVYLSSLGRRTGVIRGLWAMVFFFSWIFGEGMASATDIHWFALLSLPTSLRLLGQHIFGHELSYPIPWYYAAGVLLAVVCGAGALLMRRLRRVEVLS